MTALDKKTAVRLPWGTFLNTAVTLATLVLAMWVLVAFLEVIR